MLVLYCVARFASCSFESGRSKKRDPIWSVVAFDTHLQFGRESEKDSQIRLPLLLPVGSLLQSTTVLPTGTLGTGTTNKYVNGIYELRLAAPIGFEESSDVCVAGN